MKSIFVLHSEGNFFSKIKNIISIALVLTIFNYSYSNAQVSKGLTSEQNSLEQKWIKRIVPVYDYVVVFPLPEDWSHNPVYEKFDSNFYISEFIPKDQVLDKWTNMMTIIGYKKISTNPKQYFSSVYLMTQKICGEKNTAAQIMREQDNFIVALLMCGKPLSKEVGKSINLKNDQGEMTLYKIYKEGESLYSVFYSWRGKKYDVRDESDKNLPASMSEIKKYFFRTRSIEICNKKNPTIECKDYVDLIKRTN